MWTATHSYFRQAPAKINLALRVLGRREDGYHELDTIFVPLELADEVKVEVAPSGGPNQVTCRCPGHPELDGPDNLAARAAALYLERGGTEGIAVTIEIRKRIWTAAGLGGGSSDAAAVLLALEAHLDAMGDLAIQ